MKQPNNSNSNFILTLKYLSLIFWISVIHFVSSDEMAPVDEKELKLAREAGLQRHNMYRKWHGAPEMTLDDELNKRAQKYAEKLMETGTMQHAKGEDKAGDGENLNDAFQSKPKGFNLTSEILEAVDIWYYEFCDKKSYPEGKPNHYTQLMWDTSKHLGLGIACNKKGSTAKVVGRYKERGNEAGMIPKHVPGPKCPTEIAICDAFKAKKSLKGECGKEIKA